MDIDEAKSRILKPVKMAPAHLSHVIGGRIIAGYDAANELVFVRLDHSRPDNSARIRIARSMLDDRQNCLQICETWGLGEEVRRTETVGLWESAK